METTCENMLLHQQSIVNITLMKMLTPSYKQIITCIYYKFKVIIIIILYFCAIYINKLIYMAQNHRTNTGSSLFVAADEV